MTAPLDLAPAATKPRWNNSALVDYCAELKARYPVNRRILLVQIPQVILGSFNREIAKARGYYAFPPTGLQYIYEAIKHRGFEVRILDLNFELLKRVIEDDGFDHNDWPTILERALDEFQPYIVGISCLFDMAIGPMLETLRRVRNFGRSVVLAGGVIATYEWKALLSRELSHFVVRGEGENKLNFLLDHLTDDDRASPPTPGVFFHDHRDYRETAGPPDVVAVRGNLIDSYGLVPIEDYYRYGSLNPFSRREAKDEVPFAAIQLTRGCRAACTFCAVRDFMGKGVRSRTTEEILEEMQFLIDRKGVRHFEWLDDDLLFYRDQVKELLQAIVDKGWAIRWSANNGLISASIDEETMELMATSGCIGFKVGIETGNEEMLKKIKKPAKHYKFLNLSRMLRRYEDVFVGGNFIVGLPEETFGQMMDSFRFALEVDLDWAAITVCQVIRGASAFSDAGEYFDHQMKTEGGETKNYIPTRESTKNVLDVDSEVRRNLDVFRLSPDLVPSEDQVKEIWFAYNVLVNYIYNKNLRPDGHVGKFLSWVKMARRAYPTNPYMALFMGLAYQIKGEPEQASAARDLAERYMATDYWRERFAAFGLDELVRDFPRDRPATFAALARLKGGLLPSFGEWLAVGRGYAPDDESGVVKLRIPA